MNLFREIHKGIRATLATISECAGRTDFRDTEAVARLRDDLDATLRLFGYHAELENRFINPLIRTYAPPVGAKLDDDHAGHARRSQELRDRLDAAASAGTEAPRRGHEFAVALSRFVGESFVHMADEEELAMPALWAALDDRLLGEVHAALLASIPPDVMSQALSWMLPAMNAHERFELLAGIRASAPAPVYGAIRALAIRVLDPGDWSRLERQLNVAVSQAA
jgi:hypothetical protein